MREPGPPGVQLACLAALEIRAPRRAQPISLLRLSLLRFVDSRFPRKFPMDMRIPPLIVKIMLESKPLKSRILVRRLAVTPETQSYPKTQ